MPDSCCVVNCTNRRGGKADVKFHRIPAESCENNRRNRWISAISRVMVKEKRLDDGTIVFVKLDKPWEPSDTTRLCSAHFIHGK